MFLVKKNREQLHSYSRAFNQNLNYEKFYFSYDKNKTRLRIKQLLLVKYAF